MTKAETYEQAWRLGFKGDFSEVDNLYHPEYSTIDHTTGIKSNLNDDKVVVSTLSDSIVLGAYEVVSESEENLTIRVYSRFKDYEVYHCATTQATYKDGKIITQVRIIVAPFHKSLSNGMATRDFPGLKCIVRALLYFIPDLRMINV